MATNMTSLDQRKASKHFDAPLVPLVDSRLPVFDSAISDEEIDPVITSFEHGRKQGASRKFTFSDVNPHTRARDYYAEQNHTIPRHHNRTRTYSAVSVSRICQWIYTDGCSTKERLIVAWSFLVRS